MPNETVPVAEQFVDLALRYRQWDLVKELPAEEMQVLEAIVTAAGFDPKAVVSGKLKGHYRDQDGDSTGTFPINGLCPFKVVGPKGGDYYFATGWLDCALRRVVYGEIRKNESREQLIEIIAAEIERSVPLLPIQLTPEGDMLCECSPLKVEFSGLDYFVEHKRDDKNLPGSYSPSGVHMHCSGYMERHEATATHDAIVCRKCHLRVLLPKEVKTYGELRQVLAVQRVQAPV